MNNDELAAQVQALSEALQEQRQEIAALRAALNARAPEIVVQQPPSMAKASAAEATKAPSGRLSARRGTSRRNLLRGAAAATAAATVGAVALGGAEQAHAAPADDGGNLIIGASNTATSTTFLTNATSTLTAAFEVSTPATDYHSSAIYGISQNGASGVIGTDNTNGVGVYGFTLGSSGVGVKGETLTDGVGVWGEVLGEPGTGTGVFGDGFTGTGVVGHGLWGVVGESYIGGYDFVANGLGIIGVNVQGTVGAPTSGNYTIGDCIRDANGDLWLCTAGDGTTLGTWVKAAHAVAGYTGGAITYLSQPIRLLDTRKGTTTTSAHQIPQQQCSSAKPFTVNVAGITFNSVTVPAGAVGAIGNVTVVTPASAGYVALVPSGAGFLGTSNVNYTAGVVVPNCFNVGLNNGNLDIIVDPNSKPVDVLIDLFAVVA